MKLSSILPFIATALPMLLVQHATPANAAALCIPGIYCPQASPSLAPACSFTEGSGTPPHASSTSMSDQSSTYVPKPSTTSDIKPTTTWTPPTPSSVVEPPSMTTPVIPVSIPASAKSTYTPTTGPAGTSSAGERHTVTTTITVSGAPQPTGSSCSTGPVQCCNSVQSASSEEASNMLGLLGVALQDVNVPVGLNCIPISVIGAGSGGTCNAQTVCCENNQFNGLINIGCSPINIGL